MHKKYRRQDRDPGWLGLIVPRCAVTCIGYILGVGCCVIYTSVKIIKNEVECRDDTVPKTVETRRHCEED